MFALFNVAEIYKSQQQFKSKQIHSKIKATATTINKTYSTQIIENHLAANTQQHLHFNQHTFKVCSPNLFYFFNNTTEGEGGE